MSRIARSYLMILGMVVLPYAEGTVSWQQVGGTLMQDSNLLGIVGQGYTTPVQTDGTNTIQSGFLAHPLLVNNPPFLVSGLSDRKEISGFSTMTVNLDTVFADFEGSLNYDVSVTGVGVSASIISRNTLSFAGIKGTSGTAQVVVTATDSTYSVSDTFTVMTQASVGIDPRTPVVPVTHELAVALPRIFASQVTGSGQGELGTSGIVDEAHSLSVNLLLPAAGTVSVHIFDQLGTPVISLDRAVDAAGLVRLEPSGDGRRVLPVTWNLRAANGAAVGAGVYLWKIELRTVDGQKLESVKRLGVKGVK